MRSTNGSIVEVIVAIVLKLFACPYSLQCNYWMILIMTQNFLIFDSTLMYGFSIFLHTEAHYKILIGNTYFFVGTHLDDRLA